MERIRLSRATYQLIERAAKALECIVRELERHNDRHERTAGEDTDERSPREL
jgi:hypothetical protein